MADRISKSVGHVGFWGYSSTFDVLEALLRANGCADSHAYGNGSGTDPIRVLLVHPGDIRHVLTTISKRKRHHGLHTSAQPLRPVHFYILESPMQVVSRDLLLLEVANDFEVPIRQRAAALLEIFGNCKVQDRTCRYIEQLGKDLVTFSATGRGRLEGLVDLSLLRYRERDDLEACFKAYSRSTVFDMDTLRDFRMRGFYEERYDSRKNLADWDYHQSVKSRASIVHIKQFKEWRVTGTAFELGDQVYCEPNRTLMSYAEGFIKQGKERGAKKEVLGFWGDITAGPYFSFGVDCDTPNSFAEGMFEIMNKNTGTEQHRHHTVEVAMYSLFSLLWELETAAVYRMKKKNDIYSGLGAEAGLAADLQAMALDAEQEGADKKVDEGAAPPPEEELPSSTTSVSAPTLPPAPPPPPAPAAAAAQAEEELAKAILRARTIVDTLAGCSVLPMVGQPSAVLTKPRWQGFFDAVFVSARSGGCLEHDWFAQVLRDDGLGLVAVETAKFLVPLTMDQKTEFVAKEEAFAAKHNWTRMGAPPVPRRRRDEKDLEDDVIFFRVPSRPTEATA